MKFSKCGWCGRKLRRSYKRKNFYGRCCDRRRGHK